MSSGNSCVENLESRMMLSATVSLTHGILRVVGDPTNANTISVGLSADQQYVNVVANAAAPRQFALAGVGRVRLFGGAAADRLTIDQTNGAFTRPVLMYGYAGNDTLTGGAGLTQIYGGAGDDAIVGGSRTSILSGGAGNDTITGGKRGDVVFGRAGNDTINGAGGNDLIFGGDGDDLITGGDGSDIVVAGAGADSVDGGAGNDVIFGGVGSDTLRGGTGNDVLYAEEGPDNLDGGAGHDTIVGGIPQDTITNVDGGSDVVTRGNSYHRIFGAETRAIARMRLGTLLGEV